MKSEIQYSSLLFLFFALTSSSFEFNLNHIIKLVGSQQNIFHFENLIIFYDQETIRGNEIDPFIQNLTNGAPNVPVFLITNQSTQYQLYQQVNKNILSIIFIRNVQSSLLETLNSVLIHIHKSKVIVAVEDESQNAEDLFEWLWDHNFIDAVAIYGQSEHQIFGFTPFPQLTLKNLTLAHQEDIFPDKLRDLMGYSFKILFNTDIPYTFKYTKNNTEIWTGNFVKLFLHFLRHANGSMKEIHNKNISKLGDLQLIAGRKTQIVLLGYGFHTYFKDQIAYSYPINLAERYFLVPTSQEIDRSLYLVAPFTSGLWTLLLGLFLFYVSIDVLKSRIERNCCMIGSAITNSVCKILYLPQPNINSKQLNFRNLVVFFMELILGFIISNLYLAMLSSCLSTILYEPQIQSLADIRKANLDILILPYEKQILIESGALNGYEDLVKDINISQFAKRRSDLSFVPQACYPIDSLRAPFILAQQQYSKRPLYSLSKFISNAFAVSLPLQIDSPFLDILNDFLFRIKQFGLELKWQREVYYEAILAGIYKKYNYETLHQHIFQLEHLSMAWYLLLAGLTVSCFCFLCERYCYIRSRL